MLWTEGVVQLGKLLFSSKARMTLNKPWAEIGKKLGTGGSLIHHISTTKNSKNILLKVVINCELVETHKGK